MMIKLILIANTLLPAVAACEIPHIVPRIVYPGEEFHSHTWLSAPHILVVQILHIGWQGREVKVVAPSSRFGGISMRPVCVVARVENIIRGKAVPSEITFYYFASSVVVPRNQDLNPGSRYIVFLRDESGILRTVTDLTSSEILVLSGAHEQSELPVTPPSAKVGGDWNEYDMSDAIAYVLFTPGVGCDSAALTERLIDTIERAGRLLSVPPEYLVALMRALRTNSDQRLRTEACSALLGEFRLQDACIDDALRASDPEVQRMGGQLLARARSGEAKLLRDLGEDPLGVAIYYGDSRDFKSALTRFATDQRTAVRRRACEILHVLYTTAELPQCDGVSKALPH